MSIKRLVGMCVVSMAVGAGVCHAQTARQEAPPPPREGQPPEGMTRPAASAFYPF